MQRHVMERYRQEHADSLIKLDPYLLRSMNLLPHQTFYRIKGYNIAGVLAFLSFSEIHLIAVLSEKEISLINQLRDSLGAFLCALDRPGAKEPLRLHIPVGLAALEPMPDRPSIAFIKLRMKNIPPDLMELVCSLFDEIEARKLKHERYGEEILMLTNPETRIPGLNPMADLAVQGGKPHPCTILGLSSKTARLRIDSPGFIPSAEEGHVLRIKGPTQVISVEASLAEGLGGKALDPGEYEVALGFNNDLLSLVDAMHDRRIHFRRLKAQYDEQNGGGKGTTSPEASPLSAP